MCSPLTVAVDERIRLEEAIDGFDRRVFKHVCREVLWVQTPQQTGVM